jgi:HAD superfamily hydrolase (TIGR01509 family)
MIKAIFWDNDGVLVNTEHLYFLATQQTMATAGITLTRETFLEYFMVQGTGAWHLAEEKGLTPDEIERLRRERNRLYSQLLRQENTLIEGVHEVLAALHGKYLMGVVTTSRKDHFDLIHQRTEILKYFDFVLTANDYQKVKPDPEPYLRAIEKSGLPAEECLAVEDSERGLLSARSAGLKCIVVPSELTRAGKFVGAYKVLENLSELVAELSQPT